MSSKIEDSRCGISHWVAADAVDTKHSISSPGDSSMFAYEFDQLGAIGFKTRLNLAYTLTLRTYFGACRDGFVGVMLNYAPPVYTVDTCDFGAGAVSRHYSQLYFTATVSPWNLRFEFETGERTAVVESDNGMYIFWANASCSGSLYELRDILLGSKRFPIPLGAVSSLEAFALEKECWL